MATINVGEALKTSGEEIQAMAATFQEILDESYDLVSKITADWQGQAQTAFLADFTRTKEQLASLPETVTGLGKGAVNAAEQYIQTDTAAGSR